MENKNGIIYYSMLNKNYDLFMLMEKGTIRDKLKYKWFIVSALIKTCI